MKENNKMKNLVDKNFTIEIQPAGRRIKVQQGTNLLTAVQLAGVDLVAACSGAGFCGTCRVRLINGKLTPPSKSESELLGQQILEKGMRIACMAQPLSDIKIEVPLSSLPVAQRLQVNGEERTTISPQPRVYALDVDLAPPELTDLRSDVSRIEELLDHDTQPKILGNLQILGDFSRMLRKNNWKVRLAVRNDRSKYHIVSTFPLSTPLLGIAVDLGSTKLALYLVNLKSGAILGNIGVMNPQITYGEDVMSRIAFANKSEENRLLLQTRLIDTLNEAIMTLCNKIGADTEQIVDAVMVGNTAIHHFFCGLPVKQLGASPYVPVISDEIDFSAKEVGLHLAPGATVYMPANIAGFVGADHTAALLSAALRRDKMPRVLIDIGTNTEISLSVREHLYTCSTASGPAFEGAHIRDGMRAAPGAIEQIQLENNRVVVTTIDHQAPVGICGTGILSGIAQLLEHGVLNRLGNFEKNAVGVHLHNGQSAFLVVSAENTGHGRDIIITRKDINEIQLAKGAIRAGIEVLLEKAELYPDQVTEWIIAGAFGTYLDVPSALIIGMFPNVPVHRFQQIGNAAGMGAKNILISQNQRQEAANLIKGVEYVELTVYPNFKKLFLNALYY